MELCASNIILVILGVAGASLVLNTDALLGSMPYTILTCTYLCFLAPTHMFTMNLGGGHEWMIWKFLQATSTVCVIVTSLTIQFNLESEQIENSWQFAVPEWADLWMEVARAASLLYLFPLYFAFLRWRIEEDSENAMRDSEFNTVLPGGIEVRVRVLAGSLASTVLRSAEFRRSIIGYSVHYGLVFCTIGAIAAVDFFFGSHAAKNAAALLTLASTVSYTHSAYRFFYEDDDLPRSTEVRATLRLLLVFIPAAVAAAGWLYARDVISLTEFAKGSAHLRQPASVYFHQMILPRENRQRWGWGR